MSTSPLQILTLGAAAGGALLLVGLLARARLWLRGVASGGFRPLALLTVPRRYLVDVHDVVVRDRASARLHVAAAGGFLTAIALVLVRYGMGYDAIAIDAVLTLAGLAFLGGTLGFVLRRQLHPKAATGQFSRGKWSRFGWWLTSVALGLLTLHAAITFELGGQGLQLVAACLASAGLIGVLGPAGWSGALRHALAGTFNLAFHRRPARFDRRSRAVALLPPEPHSRQTGVGRPSDFSWNQLLSFDACVECGRCEVACPAFAAGQPLNPKKFIQDLVTGMAGPASDRKYRGSPHPGIPVGMHGGAPDEPVVPGLVEADTVWSCTTCRACVEECPMMIEHVDAMVDLRRFLVNEEGALEGAAARVLEETRLADTRSGKPLGERFDWASDLALPRISPGRKVDVLLWAGEAAYDVRGQRTLRALVRLMRTGGVDFAVLGEEEADVGDLARRLGDEQTFMGLFERNCATLQRFQFSRIVTADPHVFQCLGEEYAALGKRWTVLHHSMLLAELFAKGRLQARYPHTTTVTYHDPCYLGRYMGEYDAPRKVLAAIGAPVAEMERSARKARCCGGGGGAPLVDVPGPRRIPDMRMDDARGTGAKLLAVACPQCAVMFEGVTGERPEVADIAELAEAAVLGR